MANRCRSRGTEMLASSARNASQLSRYRESVKYLVRESVKHLPTQGRFSASGPSA
jgi:hypothetical protein